MRFWTWAADMAPGSEVARGNLAYADLAAGRVVEAEAEARKLPTGYEIVLARVLVVEGRVGEAVDALSAAIALNPDHAPTIEERAELLGRLGRWEESLADCRTVMRLSPTGLEPLAQRAMALGSEMTARLEGPTDAARAFVDRAEAAAEFGDAATWLHLAEARIALRDGSGAERALAHAVASGADPRELHSARVELNAAFGLRSPSDRR